MGVRLASGTSRITCKGVRRNFYNSLIMAIPATLVSTMLGAVNGYILSKWRFRGSEFLFACMTSGVFMPGQVAPASGESSSRSCCHMRSEIKKLHSKVGETTVYLTHDQIEAMTLATRIAAPSSSSTNRQSSTPGPPTCWSPASCATRR
jgi:hypothetical protein